MESEIDNDQKQHIRIKEIIAIKTEDDLNKQAEQLIAYFKTCAGLDKKFGGLKVSKRKTEGPNKQKIDQNNEHEIQALYKRQVHRAMQEILLGPSYYCCIDSKKIENHYKKLFSVKPECHIAELPPALWQNKIAKDVQNYKLEKNMTSKEVYAKLMMKIHNKLSNSKSVGLDNLKYIHLLKVDPDCSILTAFFNACLNLQRIPKVWKLTYSVLIKSTNGDVNDIKNWYSLTMHSTMSKLFQSIIAARLISWSKNTNRLSVTQKSFLLNNAACESSFILQECKKYAKINGKDLVIAWLDFSHASDSIPQEAVLHALQRHTVPTSIRNIIASILDSAQTKFRTSNDNRFTNEIDILKGLPQGAPINPILFDLTIEPILRILTAEKSHMFKIFNQDLNHFAIPNELTLIAESTSNLQYLLNLVEKTAKSIGLSFNVHKCSTYHYDSKKNEPQESRFIFYGQPLNLLPEKEIESYFGVKQGLSIGQTGIPTVEEMINSIEVIGKSKLDKFQKIEAVLTFIIPRVENCLRGLEDITRTPLDEADKTLRNKLKEWTDLLSTAGTESIVFQVIHLCKKTMYLPFLDLLYVMKVVQAFKMFNSTDETVKLIALKSLTAEVLDSMKNKSVTSVPKEILADYLSGNLEIQNTKSNSMWYMVREATLQLKIKIYLSWQFQNNKMLLAIGENNKKEQPTLLGNSQSDVMGRLKNYLITYYVDNIKRQNIEHIYSPTISAPKIKGHKKGSKMSIQAKLQNLKVTPVQSSIPVTMQLSNFPVLYAVR